MVETYESNTKKIAVLIDGDNAQPSLIREILAEAGKYGALTIRRIYGDWTTSNMQGWKDTLNAAAVQPIQQFRFTVGKNATDSAMIIDAMDILHSKNVDGFCVVSSDSDYHPYPGERSVRHGDREADHSQILCQRLQCLHLHREPGYQGKQRKNCTQGEKDHEAVGR
jgi:uncharacterized LabA/DUF88 family protein